METAIMEFDIVIDSAEINSLESPCGSVTFIPFTGSVTSDLFTGTVLPGAADVQVENAAGCRNMCAKYMFLGTDTDGRECRLFVENNGWFNKGNSDSVVSACPRFLSDSPKLSAYLSQPHFRSEVHGNDHGVTIKIFDTMKSNK